MRSAPKASALTTEQEKDQELARQINREARANPNSPFAGKYVGIFQQQVVAVGDSLDDLEAQFEALGIGPREGACIEASADYDEAYSLWGGRAWPG